MTAHSNAPGARFRCNDMGRLLRRLTGTVSANTGLFATPELNLTAVVKMRLRQGSGQREQRETSVVRMTAEKGCERTGPRRVG